MFAIVCDHFVRAVEGIERKTHKISQSKQIVNIYIYHLVVTEIISTHIIQSEKSKSKRRHNELWLILP